MRLLVVEDQKKMSGFLKKGLGEAGYSVDVAETGGAGESLAAENSYDLVILDVMLPDQNGFDTAPRSLGHPFYVICGDVLQNMKYEFAVLSNVTSVEHKRMTMHIQSQRGVETLHEQHSASLDITYTLQSETFTLNAPRNEVANRLHARSEHFACENAIVSKQVAKLP